MEEKELEQIKNEIKTVMDFPIKGIAFRDITPLFLKPELFKKIVKKIAEFAKKEKVDVILGPESRGFLFGLPVALELNLPFVLARKPGKLPREVVTEKYHLEYGQGSFSIHVDAIKKKQKVLIIDDLLATGGTVKCLENLVHKLGGTVSGSAYLIELTDLKGRKVLSGDVWSLIQY